MVVGTHGNEIKKRYVNGKQWIFNFDVYENEKTSYMFTYMTSNGLSGRLQSIPIIY